MHRAIIKVAFGTEIQGIQVISLIILLDATLILVQWVTTEYNYGGHFDGSFFTVPEDGIYTFHLTVAQTHPSSNHGGAHIYVNENEIAYSRRTGEHEHDCSVSVTIKLQRDDKVMAAFSEYLFAPAEPKTTYFEGRLISKLES